MGVFAIMLSGAYYAAEGVAQPPAPARRYHYWGGLNGKIVRDRFLAGSHEEKDFKRAAARFGFG